MTDAKKSLEGLHAVTVVFNVKGADEFITFCKEALGAEEQQRRPGPNGVVMHADLRLEDTVVWVSEAIKDRPTAIAVAFFVPDCDGTFEKAVASGAKSVFPPAEPRWGGRWARVEDRWGNQWTFVTR